MISDKDIKNLAELARVEISSEEKEGFKKHIEDILEFVSQIQEVDVPIDKEGSLGVNKNNMREDGEPHRSGEFTEDILELAPNKKSGYFKVKKII